MKKLNTIVLVCVIYITSFSQINTFPTKFYGVAENESYTYISTNTGLYILGRDSNNIFGEVHNVQDSLGLLHIHSNYLISGDDHRLKIFNITEYTNPISILDTTIEYPISKFDDYQMYFIIRLGLGNWEYKFLLADITNNEFEVKFDSDFANPSLNHFTGGSEFYFPYAFINFDAWWYDTLRTYRFNPIQNNFIRLPQNFIFLHYFIAAAAFDNLLFTGYYYINQYNEDVYEQDKYSIDTLSNTFTHIGSYNYFGVAPEDINSFTIFTIPNGPRKYDFSRYYCEGMSIFLSSWYLTEKNLYYVYNESAKPKGIYYSQKVTPDSIILKIIDFNPSVITDNFNVALNFQLYQNYPNPFNPTTKIKFTISELRFTTLKVYDVLGNEIMTLVNEEKPAGKYEFEFDATGLPSGIYYYQLKAGNSIQTRKMIYLK